MDSLNDMIAKRLASMGMAQAISATLIVESANRVLPENVRAKTFHNGTLTVEVKNSAEAYFFKQEKDDFIETINAALSQPLVQKIFIRVK